MSSITTLWNDWPIYRSEKFFQGTDVDGEWFDWHASQLERPNHVTAVALLLERYSAVDQTPPESAGTASLDGAQPAKLSVVPSSNNGVFAVLRKSLIIERKSPDLGKCGFVLQENHI